MNDVQARAEKSEERIGRNDRFPEPLAGRVALVTGGAQGLGAAIRRNLSEAGAAVIAQDVREGKMQFRARTLSAEGGAVGTRRLDAADPGSVADAPQDIVARHGRRDIPVNDAGTDLTVSAEEMPIEPWRRIPDVNLAGTFLAAGAILPRMRKQGGGRIVNIVSTAAKRAWPNASAPHASKWGLLGLSHALHAEARPLGVKVTAVISGDSRTPFLLDRPAHIDQSTLQDPTNVTHAVRFGVTQPAETVIPGIMVLPTRVTSWP